MVPVPPDAILVVDFLNTVDVESGSDLLDDPRAFSRWCRERTLRRSDLAAARDLRRALRSMASGRAARLTPITVDVVAGRAGGLTLSTPDVVPAVAAAALALTTTGAFDRIRLCPADDCREAFYDQSRNRSRVWCDMADCGNVAKVRALRARRSRT